MSTTPEDLAERLRSVLESVTAPGVEMVVERDQVAYLRGALAAAEALSAPLGDGLNTKE